MKIKSIIIIAILCVSVSTCSAQVLNNSEEKIEDWAGHIRIEGKSNTVWSGIVTVGDSNISAKNVNTGEMEEYYISYPSVLGAFDEASKIDGFSYTVDYWPDWDAFIIKSVENDSEWWHYWVDFSLPMVDVGKFELTDTDSEIIIGYLEDWQAHLLKIYVDKSEVKKGEEITVSVRNETDLVVEDATVFVGSNSYTTDSNGNITIKITKKGNFDIYSEKNGFVRSEKKNIHVNAKTAQKNKISTQIMNLLYKVQNLYFLLIKLINIFK